MAQVTLLVGSVRQLLTEGTSGFRCTRDAMIVHNAFNASSHHQRFPASGCLRIRAFPLHCIKIRMLRCVRLVST